MTAIHSTAIHLTSKVEGEGQKVSMYSLLSSVTHTSYWSRDQENKWMQDSAMQPKGHATWPPNEKTETEKMWHASKDQGTVNSVVLKDKREDYMIRNMDKPPTKKVLWWKEKCLKAPTEERYKQNVQYVNQWNQMANIYLMSQQNFTWNTVLFSTCWNIQH